MPLCLVAGSLGEVRADPTDPRHLLYLREQHLGEAIPDPRRQHQSDPDIAGVSSQKLSLRRNYASSVLRNYQKLCSITEFCLVPNSSIHIIFNAENFQFLVPLKSQLICDLSSKFPEGFNQNIQLKKYWIWQETYLNVQRRNSQKETKRIESPAPGKLYQVLIERISDISK